MQTWYMSWSQWTNLTICKQRKHHIFFMVNQNWRRMSEAPIDRHLWWAHAWISDIDISHGNLTMWLWFKGVTQRSPPCSNAWRRGCGHMCFLLGRTECTVMNFRGCSACFHGFSWEECHISHILLHLLNLRERSGFARWTRREGGCQGWAGWINATGRKRDV